jgi:hypothetical protein
LVDEVVTRGYLRDRVHQYATSFAAISEPPRAGWTTPE